MPIKTKQELEQKLQDLKKLFQESFNREISDMELKEWLAAYVAEKANDWIKGWFKDLHPIDLMECLRNLDIKTRPPVEEPKSDLWVPPEPTIEVAQPRRRRKNV